MSWDGVRTVLCVRLDAMEDLLMTTPALRAASGGGKRHITLLTSPSGAVAAAHLPEVADVIVYDSPWMKSGTTSVCSDTDRHVLDLLSSRSFDAAVIFTVFSQSALPAALMCYFAGIPRRLAYCRENPYNLLTDWIREIEPEGGIRHEVERQLHLVSQVGWITRDDRMSLRVSDAARCSVEELAALIEAAPLVLTNNTGPAHIAAAVGTPVVDLYALTNPQHTPWRVPSTVLSHDVPCRNCFKSVCPEGHHHCLTLIAPERVTRACAHLWEKNRERREDSRNHAYSGNQCSLS